MVTVENHIGKIVVSENYLTEIVRHTVTGCFGVADVCSVGTLQAAVSAIAPGRKVKKNNGVIIRSNDEGELIIELHITVTYGTNINAAVDSIVNKVRFTVEEAAGVSVKQVRVYVDDMKA